MQTKWQSFLESLSSTAVGYVACSLAYYFVFSIEVTGTMIMTSYFTGQSLLIKYITRRYFNKKGGE